MNGLIDKTKPKKWYSQEHCLFVSTKLYYSNALELFSVFLHFGRKKKWPSLYKPNFLKYVSDNSSAL